MTKNDDVAGDEGNNGDDKDVDRSASDGDVICLYSDHDCDGRYCNRSDSDCTIEIHDNKGENSHDGNSGADVDGGDSAYGHDGDDGDSGDD